MNLRARRVALLLFGSGLTALVYQVAWLRQLRLIFGASTPASAAVTAIFMGGLGAGAWLLGRRADTREAPLAFYGKLELGIAVSAAATPGLVWLVERAYVATGGSFRLGLAGRIGRASPACGPGSRLADGVDGRHAAGGCAGRRDGGRRGPPRSRPALRREHVWSGGGRDALATSSCSRASERGRRSGRRRP